MFGISTNVAVKASVAAVASMVISVATAWTVVPMLGGHPDGPGFWMSVILPIVIAWPASAFHFTQSGKIRAAHESISAMHEELNEVHGQLQSAYARLQEKSRIDGMTGALNRETFLAQFHAARENDRLCALLVADADHFKRINDEFGHQSGDAALQAIAESVRSVLRPQDFWGRLGGEEFAIFLDGVGIEEAGLIADAVRQAVASAEVRSGEQTIAVSISIGGICFDGGFEPEAMLLEADRRLYQAKRAGRNRVTLHAHCEKADRNAAA